MYRSDSFAATCAEKAAKLQGAGMGKIHGGTVAVLLHGSATQNLTHAWRVARILGAKGFTEWTGPAVMEAYRLNRLRDADLLKLDPEAPAPSPTATSADPMDAWRELAARVNAK